MIIEIQTRTITKSMILKFQFKVVITTVAGAATI